VIKFHIPKAYVKPAFLAAIGNGWQCEEILILENIV
jgi:hypothetical protein